MLDKRILLCYNVYRNQEKGETKMCFADDYIKAIEAVKAVCPYHTFKEIGVSYDGSRFIFKVRGESGETLVYEARTGRILRHWADSWRTGNFEIVSEGK